MAFQFPWTNLHELNLDWFLSKFKQFTNNYLETTATVELIPTTEQPEVTVTGGTLDDDTDIVDPFTFNFKLPINTIGGAVNSVNGMVGDVVLDKTDIGLGNVDNVQQYSATNPPPYPVTSVNGMTGDVIVQGANGNYAPAIITSASGTIAHFTDGADNIPVNDFKIGIAPAQSGSGDPAPDNIRPISGWTGANVTRAKKNLISISNLNIPANVDQTVDIGQLITLPAGTYTLSWTLSATVSATRNRPAYALAGVNYYATSDSKTAGRASWTFTLATEATVQFKWWYHTVSPACTVSDFQLEVGVANTAYDEYVAPTTLAIDWTTEAGTVYGGTLDVTTGVLSVDMAIVDIGDLTWTYNSTAGHERFISNIFSPTAKPAPGSTLANAVCSIYKTATSNQVYAHSTDRIFCIDGDGKAQVYDSSYTDAPTFQTSVTGQKIAYELATPTTYQLTPHQINTLLGVNNIWSNTGDTTVEYTADTKEYIQNLTQPTEDDMIANTAIASGKFFMIGNNLYKATTAIASGSQIIPGTNATPLSLADALNLL